MNFRAFLIVASAILFTIVLRADTVPSNLLGNKFKSNAEKELEVAGPAREWNTIGRWFIEFEFVFSPATTNLVSGYHKILAAAAPGEIYSLGAPIGRNPWQTSPFCQEFILHSGTMCHNWPFKRTYFERPLKSGDGIPQTIPQNPLWMIVPAWPVNTYKMPRGENGAIVIAAEAIQSSEYRLLADYETVGGESCAVLDFQGVDRIWIAMDKSFCVMRREFLDLESGRAMVRMSADKLSMIAPKLWLPTDLRYQVFSGVQIGNHVGLEHETRIKVVRCLLNNDVQESTFIASHSSGTLKYDDDHNFKQISPGGEDLLSDTVTFLTKYERLPNKPMAPDHLSKWFVGGLTSGVCFGLLYILKKKSP